MATALDKWADAEPSWDYPVIIESHINGVRTKEMNPNTPVGYDEIAEVSGLPLGTVKNRIFRAREAMRKHLIRLGIEGVE